MYWTYYIKSNDNFFPININNHRENNIDSFDIVMALAQR